MLRVTSIVYQKINLLLSLLYPIVSCCVNILYPDGRKCWDSVNLTSIIRTSNRFNIQQIRRLSEDFTNKCHQLNFNDHLKLSIIAGLIDKYEGASNYLIDRSSSLAQTNEMLVCRVESKKVDLDLLELVNDHIPRLPHDRVENIEKRVLEATHIVISVTYGAEAYCVLTEKFDGDNQEEVERKLSMMADKMEKALMCEKDVDEFKEEFDQVEKERLGRSLSCRLYTDFSDPQNHPVSDCNVFDAYNHCHSLIEEMQKADGDKAVPISVTLCPLKVIMGTVGTFRKLFEYRDVDSGLVTRSCHIMDKLNDVVAKAIDVFRLHQFPDVVMKYQEIFKESLKRSVLKARSNEDSDDGEVDYIISNAENHPLFNPSLLKRWLRYKKGEMELIEIMSSVEGIVFATNRYQLERKLAASANRKYVLVLCVPPLDEKNNSSLEEMRNYVDTFTESMEVDAYDYADDEERVQEGENQVRDDRIPWHMIQRKRMLVLEKIREITNHMKKNKNISNQLEFFITFDGSSKRFGCSYSIYEGDKLLKSGLRRLPGPPTELWIRPSSVSGAKKAKTLAKTSFSSISVQWNYENLGYPCYFLLEYRSKGNPDWQQHRTTKSGETETLISFQHETAMIEIRLAAETCIGRSEFSNTFEFLIHSDYEMVSPVVFEETGEQRNRKLSHRDIRLD